MNTYLLIYLFFGLCFTITVFTLDYSGPEMARETLYGVLTMTAMTLFYPLVLLIRAVNTIHARRERAKRLARRDQYNRSAHRDRT